MLLIQVNREDYGGCHIVLEGRHAFRSIFVKVFAGESQPKVRSGQNRTLCFKIRGQERSGHPTAPQGRNGFQQQSTFLYWR